jgi:hypothetical protein
VAFCAPSVLKTAIAVWQEALTVTFHFLLPSIEPRTGNRHGGDPRIFWHKMAFWLLADRDDEPNTND